MILDLTDPAVLEMADRNHSPEEHMTRNEAGWAQSRVACSFCELDWPCPTRVTIRRMAEQQEERWRKEKAQAVEAEAKADVEDFRTSLMSLLNRFGYDGRLRTMDWIIADLLVNVLDNLQTMLYQRDTNQTGTLDAVLQLRSQGGKI